MLMDMCLPKFDIYQGTLLQLFKKPHKRIFLKKSVLVDVRLKYILSNIALFLPDNLSAI